MGPFRKILRRLSGIRRKGHGPGWRLSEVNRRVSTVWGYVGQFVGVPTWLLKIYESSAVEVVFGMNKPVGGWWVKAQTDMGFRTELIDVQQRGHSARLRLGRLEKEKAGSKWEDWKTARKRPWKSKRWDMVGDYGEKSEEIGAKRGIDVDILYEELVDEGRAQHRNKWKKEETERRVRTEGKRMCEGLRDEVSDSEEEVPCKPGEAFIGQYFNEKGQRKGIRGEIGGPGRGLFFEIGVEYERFPNDKPKVDLSLTDEEIARQRREATKARQRKEYNEWARQDLDEVKRRIEWSAKKRMQNKIHGMLRISLWESSTELKGKLEKWGNRLNMLKQFLLEAAHLWKQRRKTPESQNGFGHVGGVTHFSRVLGRDGEGMVSDRLVFSVETGTTTRTHARNRMLKTASEKEQSTQPWPTQIQAQMPRRTASDPRPQVPTVRTKGAGAMNRQMTTAGHNRTHYRTMQGVPW